MEISQLEQFRAIAECKTMREAAEKLYLSQPTLSYNLKKLESELGCSLFMRAHNRLQLTPYGEIVLEHSAGMSERMQAMLDAIESLKRREEETLHVGCFSLPVASFVMTRVAAELPDTMFEVVTCATPDLVEGLQEGRFDVLIATDVARVSGFKWKQLFEENAFVSLPANGDAPQVVSANDMAGMRYSLETGLAGYSDWYAYILREAHVPDGSIDWVPFKEHLRVKDTLPTCNLISSFIMDFVRTSESRAIVPIDESFARRNVGLLHLPQASEKVLSFAKHMTAGADTMFSGNAYIPFFLFPEDTPNLTIETQ